MSIPNLPRVNADMQLDDLANLVARMIKEMEWLLTGNLDVKNIRADGIQAKNIKAGAVVAEKIDVDQLSAISADLGTIMAGVVIGALIKTAESGQRIELSSVENLLKAINANGSELTIQPDIGGTPAVLFKEFGGPGSYIALLGGALSILAINGIELSPGLGNKVMFKNWGEILNTDDNVTLQQEFANIYSWLSGLSARVTALENA